VRHLLHTLLVDCGPFFSLCRCLWARGRATCRHAVCGLTSYRISPRSPEANTRVPCEPSRRRLHLSVRILVPQPSLAAPTSFASLADMDLRCSISRARIRPLLATTSLPLATFVTEPAVRVSGDLDGGFGRVRRNQFKR
jgi:hypothetical protein